MAILSIRRRNIFLLGRLASFAHEGAPIFLVPVTAPGDAEIGEEIDIPIAASWQVCEEICIPEEANFQFSMPVLEDAPLLDGRRYAFTEARQKIPEKITSEALLTRAGERLVLTVKDWEYASLTDAFYFPDIEGLTKPSGAQHAKLLDNKLQISMEPGWSTDGVSDHLEGVLRFSDDRGQRHAVSLSAKLRAR